MKFLGQFYEFSLETKQQWH